MDRSVYRRCAREYFDRPVDTDAFAGGAARAALLACVHVPPSPDGSRRHRRIDPSDGKPVGELLATVKLRAALIARPGGGKTTTLLQHAHALALADDGPLPVYVPLRELDGGYDDLEKLITECMRRVAADATLPDLADGDWVLLLDGVHERAGAGDPFRRLVANFSKVRMIFSTREPAAHFGMQIELLPLAPADRDALVAAWIPTQAAALQRRFARDARLDELSRTPLLLALLCDGARDGHAPASTRAALLRASLAIHARRYADRVGSDARTDAQIDGWLACLAHGMLRRGALSVGLGEAVELLRTAPHAPADPDLQLRHLAAFHLLSPDTPGVVEFVHPLIQEFYAAQHLHTAGLPERRTLIREHINHAAWTEPLRLFAEACDDRTTATRLVDAARDVDAVLAARLVGSFPPALQPALLERLHAADDMPGTRLTRALTVGTDAAIPELARLAAHPDANVRFQVADGLWDVASPDAAAINAGLLADAASSVVNAAAHNLRRHPAPVEALLAALRREDTPPYALSFLMRAALASDTPAAAAYGRELARVHLAGEDGPDRVRSAVRDAARAELFASRPGPCLARALVELLGEVDEDLSGKLVQVLRDSVEVVDLDPALAIVAGERRRTLIEWSLAFPGRFHVSDEQLLAAVRDPLGRFGLATNDRVFAAALARRCRGLVEWLAQLVAGDAMDDGCHCGHAALGPLLALDEAAAVHAATRGLASADPEIRWGTAMALCRQHAPALAGLRARAVALARTEADFAVYLVEHTGAVLAAEMLEEVLDHAPEAARRVAETFLELWHVKPFLAKLRDEPLRWHTWPEDMPPGVRRAVARSLVQYGDPALAERFLGTHLWHETRDVVVAHLERVVAGDDRAAVTRALSHLYEVDWAPPLATYARLIADGHSGWAMRRPEADPDATYLALRPLLRHGDPTTRQWALAAMFPPPPGHLAEFVALLDEPEFALPVAHRIVTAHLHDAFPELLRRPGLVAAPRTETDADEAFDGDAPILRHELRPIDWHTFEWTLRDAPPAVIAACLDLLAARDEPRWHRPFLEQFVKAPAFHHHARVRAALRGAGMLADEALEALLRCATADELAALDRWHDDPDLPTLSIAHVFAEVAPPHAAPLVLARLIRLVEAPDTSEHEVLRHSLPGWWLRLLAATGEARDGARIVDLARSTPDVWLAQELYRTAAEIQQRTGVYAPRHTTMPPSWTLLHLSDLHFNAPDQPERWHSALAEDLRRELGVERLDALVLSGDIVDRGRAAGYAAAEQFIDRVCDEFKVPRSRVVVVPGNHDLDREASRPTILPVRRGEPYDLEVGKKRYRIADRAVYEARLVHFAEFFARALGEPFPMAREDQARLWTWDELGVIVLGLSSVGEIDHLRPGNATIDDTAISRALAPLRRDTRDYLKIAVFHHPLDSADEDRLRDARFLERLAVAGFSLVLHGHVHRSDNRLVRYDRTAGGRRIEVVGAGTFGARTRELPTATPWQYNLLRFTGDRVRVETRRRDADNAPWKAHACWSTGPGEDPRPWYDLDLARA